MTKPARAKSNGREQDVEMIPVLVRHKIQVLLEAGHSRREVAARAGVSLASVRRVKGEPEVVDVDDAAQRKARNVGRPSKVHAFAERVRGWLGEDPELATQELLRRAREHGYDGHKSAFYALASGLRPKRAVPVVRFEGLPGEFSQHDFGEVVVTFVDGRSERVQFFASRLKHSRFCHVELVSNQKVETLVRGLARAFVAFGGLPLMAVFDRPKTVVKKSGLGRAVEAFNPTFAQAMLDLGVGVEMCAPRSGWQKGAVEQLVGWVKGSFFKSRKFVDHVDLEAQLSAWLAEVNTKTPSRATGVIPEVRRQEELSRLRPIRLFPEKLALRFPVFVGPTAEVVFEGVRYSMPATAVSVPATLFLYERRLVIVTTGRRVEVEHPRRSKEDPVAPLPAHRAQKIAAVHGERAKLYAKREALIALGPAALTLLTHLLHANPRRSYRVVHELFRLLQTHGDLSLRAALDRAVADDTLDLAAVRRALAKPQRTRGRTPSRPKGAPRGPTT